MKVHLGKKRGGDNLRPLTEKEIQERLYGRYQGSVGVKENEERPLLLGPTARASVSLPWRSWLSSGLRGGGSLLSGLTNLLTKTGRGVGIGLAILGVLFVFVQTLNNYRSRAIQEEKTRPRRQAPDSPLKRLPAETVLSPVKPEIPPPSPPAEIPAAPVPEKAYVIQICTYAREEDAERLVETVEGAQFPAFVQPMERANGKTFYPVFIGRFETYPEAQRKLEEFRSKPVSNDFPDSFVRAL